MSQTDTGTPGTNTPPTASDENAPGGTAAPSSPAPAATKKAGSARSAKAPAAANATQAAPTGGPGAAPRPKPSVPRTVVCPVSGTVFNPRQTGGKCPVCGEQVVPAELVAQSSVGGKLADTRAGTWLGKQGNWRIVALIALVAYQLGLFAWVWAELAAKHAF